MTNNISNDSDTGSHSRVSIGVLFSQSGPMAVTETAHLKGTLMAIDEINENGGVGGLPLHPIIEEPKSDPDIYRELAKKLLTQDRVSVIFGCCSSAARKAVLPIVERHGALLFYPSFYEGFEYSPNIVYTGATPNQTVIPLVEYLFNKYGKKFGLVGSDYIFPREINRIVKEFLVESNGSATAEIYLPQGADDERFHFAAEKLMESGSSVILSTVVGGDTAKLYEACHSKGINAKICPIASLTTSESELACMSVESRAGHITALPYFQSIETDTNQDFLARYESKYGPNDMPCVYSEATYSQVRVMARALTRMSSQSPELLLSTMQGAQFEAPQGKIMIDPDNNHVYVTPRIGKSTTEGTFRVVWQAPEPVKPDPYLVAYDRTIVTI